MRWVYWVEKGVGSIMIVKTGDLEERLVVGCRMYFGPRGTIDEVYLSVGDSAVPSPSAWASIQARAVALVKCVSQESAYQGEAERL